MSRADTWRRELAAPLQALQDEIYRLIDSYRQPGPLGPRRPEPEPDRAESGTWTPVLDLYETPDEIGLMVDLPGVEPSAIELTIADRLLTLRGEKLADAHSRGQGRTLERTFGPFCRQVELPELVDLERVEAESRLGVLFIRLPKVEAARTRSIPIRTS